MKVPTYQRESGRPSGVAGQRMSVQASPSAASAGARAAQQFFDQATDTSLSWYEKELTNRRRVQKRKADIAAEEEIIAAAQQAQQTDPNEAETYFDTEVERIKRTYGEQFENDFLRQNFELDFDSRAVSKRVAVRANASERRIGDALATYEIQEEQLQNRIINAETQLDREVAQYDLDRMYDEISELGYLSKGDIDKRRVAASQFITKESYVARINAAGSIEEQQAIIDELNEFDNLLPSTVAQLVNKSEAEISEIVAAENRQEAIEKAFADSVSEEQRYQLELRLRQMTPAQVRSFYEYALTEEGQEQLQDTLTTSDRRQLLNFAETRAKKIGGDLAAQKSQLSDTIDGFEDLMTVGKLPDQSALKNAMQAAVQLGDEKSQAKLGGLIENVETTRIIKAGSPAMVEQYQAALEQQIDNSALVQELFLLTPEEMQFENAEQASLARQLKIVNDYKQNLDEAVDKGQHIQFYAESGEIEMPEFDLSNVQASIAETRSAFTKIKGILLQDPGIEPGQEPPLSSVTRGVNFFTDTQAVEVNKYISRATPAEKSMLAMELQEAAKFAPQVWEQIADSGSSMFALAGAINDFAVAERIFLGEAIIGDKTQVTPTKSQVINIFADRVGGVGEVYGQEDYKTVLDATLAHYAATRSNPGESDVDKSEFARSIDAVTGGIGEYNGFKLELPRGTDEDTFDAWIENMSPRMVEYFAPEGLQNMTYEEAADLIKRSRLVNREGGGYAAVYNQNAMEAIFRKNGDPLVIEWNSSMAQILADERKRPGEDPRIASPKDRWLFLSGRPTGFLDAYEREELFGLQKEFGRASSNDILEYKASRLEAEGRPKEAAEVRARMTN